MGRVIHTLRYEYISDDENSRMSTEFKEHVKVVLAPLEATLASSFTRLSEHHASSLEQHEKLIKDAHDHLSEASEKFKAALDQQVHVMVKHNDTQESLKERTENLAIQTRKEFRNICYVIPLVTAEVPNKIEVQKSHKSGTAYLLDKAYEDLEKRQADWDEQRSEYKKKIKQLEEKKQKLLDQISYVGTKNYQRKLERTKELSETRKMTEDSAKIAEENATLHKIAEHNEGVQHLEAIKLKVLRDLLSDARKDRDAALLENQNLKRKREGSASPPPPQIKLLTRPQGASLDKAVPSPVRTESPYRNSLHPKDPGIGKIVGPTFPPLMPTYPPLMPT
jgi:hypothetical protein